MARSKGHIRKRGGRYEIAVSLGRDPITKRYRYAYAYARTEEDAKQQQRDRLLDRVAEGRDPDSNATINVLLDRWLAVADLELSTRESHEGYIRRTIRPALGDWQLRKLQHRVDVIDQLYAHLRRCSKLCNGRPYVEKHATEQPRSCAAERCRRHVCRPMQPHTIRQIHAILRTALGYALKWGWMERNPAQHALAAEDHRERDSPARPKQAAVLVETAWDLDRELGVFVWLAMVTGARRGELCALRWSDLRMDEGDLLIARSYVTRRSERAARKAGVACRLHDLRHYTATQLIAAGTDLRTVAGHSGGGSTSPSSANS